MRNPGRREKLREGSMTESMTDHDLTTEDWMEGCVED
jgi:hypothetical protein